MKIEEAKDISRIYAISWKSAYRGIVSQQYLDQLSEYRWTKILTENSAISFVLLNNGNYIGTASISPARDEIMKGWGEILSLYLLPDHFGKGYGKLLLDYCIKELNIAGFSSIYLWTLEKNIRARDFFNKNGFMHDGQQNICEIDGQYLTLVRYIFKSDNMGDIE